MRLSLPELKLALGLWYGNYDGITRTWLRWLDSKGTYDDINRTWLRWYDESGNLISTDYESAKKERIELQNLHEELVR